MTKATRPVISAIALANRLGLNPPTPEQAAVIEAPLEPSVVIAGAGSGKTETMAARVVWLVANRAVPPAEVLGLTFTRKAAAELGRRVRRRLAQWRHVVERDEPDDHEHLAQLLAGEPTVLTYAAYAGRLVGEHALRVGAEPSARLLSPAISWQLADSIVRRYPGSLPPGIGALSSVSRYVLALAGQFADHLVEPDAVADFSADLLDRWAGLPNGPKSRSEFPTGTRDFITAVTHRHVLLPLVSAFAAAKQTLGAVDFGDQMTLAARLAGLDEVAAIERGRYRAVLLDEYQDTGHAQVRLLADLFGGGHPVTAVGDPFQSIYGWRGASAGNIGRFSQTFRRSDGEPAAVFTLATSWRNDDRILTAANLVAAELRQRVPGTVALRPRPDASPGSVRAALLDTVEDEADWVADHLARAWAERPAGDRTAAVLVRRRSQIPALHEALLAAGLPVEVVGLGGLLTTPEVIDVVATLRVLADHKSGPALARLLAGARWRVGAHDLAGLSERARWLAASRRVDHPAEADGPAAIRPDEPVDAGSLIEALDDLGPLERYSSAGGHRMARLSGELRGLRRRLSAPLPELVAEVERTIGVDIEVSARADRRHVGRAHLDRFLDEAARFSAEADEATLGAFLAFLEAAEEEENGLESGEVSVERERVQLLTVHGAKGLEWDLVAVPGLVETIFPAAPRGIDWTRTRHVLPGPLRGDHADLPRLELAEAADRKEVAELLSRHGDQIQARHQLEERRLAYVALTRARELLLTSGYVWDGAIRPHVPSPFLVELRELAEIDQWSEVDPDAANPRLAEAQTAQWPIDPLGARRPDLEAGAALVRAAADRLAAGEVDPRAEAVAPLPGLLSGDPDERRARWSSDAEQLLAERARLAASAVVEVELPARLSVSQLVALQRDPEQLAHRLRRPLPAKPAPLARRGTAFHTWLEQRWSAQALLDIDELPGAADETADPAHEADLQALREAFEASPWATRTPTEVEVPFEMAVGATVIRGRMDAVFGGPDGWTVVDWKTGARPRGADARAAAVQLAAYRLAWARLQGIDDADLGQVRAAFQYVRSNETVAPADLLDAAGLRALLTDSAEAPAGR
jgi:DNA helicase-2/ATP-dependent DNA helicase PcrA